MLNQPGGYLLSRRDCLRFGLGAAVAGVSGAPVLTLGDETPKPQSAPKSVVTQHIRARRNFAIRPWQPRQPPRQPPRHTGLMRVRHRQQDESPNPPDVGVLRAQRQMADVYFVLSELPLNYRPPEQANKGECAYLQCLVTPAGREDADYAAGPPLITPQPARRCYVATFSQVETCVALDDRRHLRVMPLEDAEIKGTPQPRGFAEPIAGGICRSNNAAGSIRTNGRK